MVDAHLGRQPVGVEGEPLDQPTLEDVDDVDGGEIEVPATYQRRTAIISESEIFDTLNPSERRISARPLCLTVKWRTFLGLLAEESTPVQPGRRGNFFLLFLAADTLSFRFPTSPASSLSTCWTSLSPVSISAPPSLNRYPVNQHEYRHPIQLSPLLVEREWCDPVSRLSTSSRRIRGTSGGGM